MYAHQIHIYFVCLYQTNWYIDINKYNIEDVLLVLMPQKDFKDDYEMESYKQFYWMLSFMQVKSCGGTKLLDIFFTTTQW